MGLKLERLKINEIYQNNLLNLKKNFYLSFFFLIFFFVPNFLDFILYDKLIEIKFKFIILFFLSIYFSIKVFNNKNIELYKKKILTYIFLILITVYISSIFYYYFIVNETNFNKSFYFEGKIIFSFIYQFSIINLCVYIWLNYKEDLFETFNKIIFYFSTLIILEFIIIKVIFFLNYNNLTLGFNFYELILASNPIVYYDKFFSEGRIFRSIFINDHLITSFILFLGFLSNVHNYERQKKVFFIFLGIFCLLLSFYNLESRLTVLINIIMLLIFFSWRLISKIKINFILIIIIIGFYSSIILIKIGCTNIFIDNNQALNTLCKIDSLYDRFSLALFSLTTWIYNPISFGLEMLNNFYVLNKNDLFLNNDFTSQDSYVTITSLRNGKYAFWHGGEITYPHNFFVSSLGSLGIIFPIILYLFFIKINFKVSTLSEKYIFLMLVYSCLNSLINKMFYIETYIIFFAMLLIFKKKNEKN